MRRSKLKNDHRYRGNELKLMVDGYADLSKAIIKQWKYDGKPQGDFEGVSLWAELLQSHVNLMHRNNGVKHGDLTI